MSDAFTRPDPAAGTEGDDRYARHWGTSHDDVADEVAYRIRYADVMLLEALLPAGYELLDVGCGTGGYHRLLPKAAAIEGIDLSAPMVEEALRRRPAGEEARIRYAVRRFEELEDGARYDGIRFAGIYGWYRPWHGQAEVLAKLRMLLRPGGLAVLSYTPPRGAAGWAKALLAPSRTVVIPRARFRAMVAAAGLSAELELPLPHTTLLLARRPPG